MSELTPMEKYLRERLQKEAAAHARKMALKHLLAALDKENQK